MLLSYIMSDFSDLRCAITIDVADTTIKQNATTMSTPNGTTANWQDTKGYHNEHNQTKYNRLNTTIKMQQYTHQQQSATTINTTIGV